jgi:hypothetical protein
MSETSKDNWGLVKILIYPEGTPMPADKPQDQAPSASTGDAQPASSVPASAPSQ